jgi:hypothetical protein
MTGDIFRKRPIFGKRILVSPSRDIIESRPEIIVKQPIQQTNSNRTIFDSNQNKDIEDSNNMDTIDGLDESLKALNDLISQESPQLNVPSEVLPQPAVTPTVNEESMAANNNPTKGNIFFKFPSIKPPMGGNIHSLKWYGNKYELVESAGSTSDYVRYNNWHLNGASIWIGTSATGAVDKVGVDPASGVTGLIPQATKHIAELIRSSAELSPGRKPIDSDGRPFQFAVITVLGGQDYSAICKAMEGHYANKIYRPVFEHLGIKGVNFRAALYNSMGQLFALEVSFTNKEKFGNGRHLIFLHRANDIGGGKSDESLMEGRLSNQVSALSQEFKWWISGLERAGGKIGAIETTLGGTARIGRYALLSSCIPRSLFAADANEIINLDSAEWVKENLPSQLQEYRANFATTLLRTVWGKAGERLHGIPIVLVNRYDRSMIRTRRMRAAIAILRHMFLGNPKMDLLQGDISDERISIQREEGITNNNFMTIHDTIQNGNNGPWEQQRRIRLSTSFNLTPAMILTLAKGDDPTLPQDTATAVLEKIRGLATSQNGALPSGGFTVIDALVPVHLLETLGNAVTKDIVSKAIESIAIGLKTSGVEKPLINLYKVPESLCSDMDDIIVQISEDQPGTNVLIVSTEEVETHSKRVIMSNPNLRAINNSSVSSVYAFGRLLGRMVTAHLNSKYHHCEDDGILINAFYRHYYGRNFGNRPNLLVGGSDRIRVKKDEDGNY